jgi:hypothetical protein
MAYLQGWVSNMKEYIKEQIIEALKATGEVVYESIGAVSLVGSGILIILKIAGFDKGYKWAGILITIDVLIKYLFGV